MLNVIILIVCLALLLPIGIIVGRLVMTACEMRKPDNCEICGGTRGGVRGNENRIDGKVMCDYCTVDYHLRKNILLKGNDNANH